MDKGKPTALLLGAGAIILLFAGYMLPRHAGGAPGASVPAAESTVPAQLSADASMPEATPKPRPTTVAVYVCGEVHRSGVYTLTSDERVADALDRAGGALADADLEQLNLAEPLSDAMKIDVVRKGMHAFVSPAELAQTSGRPRSRHRGGRSSHKLQPGQTLDVNTATESELTALPGVGPGLARRIVEYRTANGPFQSVDDLQNVPGIGPSKFDKLSPYVRL